MSSLSSRGPLGQITRDPGLTQTRSAQPTQYSTARKRSNTRYGAHPPPLQLSSKSSIPNLQPSKGSSSTTNVTYDTQRITRPTASSRARVISGHSPPTGGPISHVTHPMKYGTQTTISPLAASPEALSSFSTDIVSNSLPTTLSALALNPDFELPSPSAVSPLRQPSSPYNLSPSLYNPSSSSLSPRGSNSNLRVPLHSSSRTSSAPASRKSSAGSSDRDAGLHLDMKRLLSKPAQPSYSGSSIISLPSDAEFSSASLSPRQSSVLSQQQSQRRLGTSPARRATDEPVVNTSISQSQRVLKTSPSRISLPSSASRDAGQKTRNVLRRKPSTQSHPATPTVTSFRQPSVENSIRSSSRAVRNFEAPPRTTAPRRTASSTADPVSVASVRRTQEPPPHLTPAGAVVHAYKQQEQRREQLAEMSGSNEQTRPQTVFPDVAMSSSPRGVDDEEDKEGGGIYYTVFGSTAGRVVAVGSVDDSHWDLGYDSRYTGDRSRPTTKQSSSSSSSVTAGVRTLTRKVSGKFKKPGGIIRRDVSPYDGGATRHPDEPYDGRPSMSERRSMSSPPARPLGPSMDEYVDISAGAHVPTATNGSTEAQRKEKEKTLRTMRSFRGKDKEVDREKERDGDSSPGGKIWKLVKRISQGGLRDKYSRESGAPPPVPALPKDFHKLALSRTTFDIGPSSGRESPLDTNITRFMQSRSSISVTRSSSTPQHATPRREAAGSRPSTGPRPSTTTRSSSPMSSDMASSRFFPKSQSARSSLSSYGEELPPLPNTIGQYIISPSELSKLGGGIEDEPPKTARIKIRSRARSMGAEETRTLDDDLRPSLPPPRRLDFHKNHSPQNASMPPSPTIPSFNTEAPVNNFVPSTASLSRLSLPTSEFGVLDEVATPPRPRRSSRRKPPPAALISLATASTSSSAPPTPRTPRSPNLPQINVSVGRASISGGSLHSSARDGSHSNSPSSTTSHARSPIRFRELESPRVQLTPAQKAAKWDDLLQRSDEAGGTLHLGEAGLMSDSFRFSEYSET